MTETEKEGRDPIEDRYGINEADLHGEYARLPPEIARASFALAEATGVALRAKARLKETEAVVYLTAKKLAEQSGQKMTEARLAASVEVDETVVASREDFHTAEVEKKMAEGVVAALAAKKEMLISLGASVRKEMDTFRH